MTSFFFGIFTNSFFRPGAVRVYLVDVAVAVADVGAALVADHGAGTGTGRHGAGCVRRAFTVVGREKKIISIHR